MSVDGANARDMLFVARLMAMGASDSTVDQLAKTFVDALVEELRIDAAVLLQMEGDYLRPIASFGVTLDQSLRISPESSLDPGFAIQKQFVLPLTHDQHSIGSLHLYIGNSTSKESRLNHGSMDCTTYNDVFLQTIALGISSRLFTRRSQQEHDRTQFHLRSIVDTLPFALAVFDSDNKILLSNDRARGLVGRLKWDQIDTTPNLYQICDRAGKPLPTSEWPFIKAIRQPTKSISQEYVLDFGEFQRRIILSVVPVHMEHSEQPTFISYAEDITARTEMDRRKDDFITVASHELRSPLTPLLGFMQMARHQAESKQPVDIDVLLRAERQAHRIRRLIEGLLDFSRIETGRLQLVCRQINLVEQLSLILEPWYCVSETNSSFQVTFSENPLLVMVDPDRLEQVIANIIDNALKHGRADGIVSVNVSKYGDNAVLAISNDVDGTDSIDPEHVFERFYQKGKGRGTFRTSMGLGLYISRQIIEQHGGSIELQTAPGERTTVLITLPLIYKSPIA